MVGGVVGITGDCGALNSALQGKGYSEELSAKRREAPTAGYRCGPITLEASLRGHKAKRFVFFWT